jgi:hypothetical protein
MGSLKQVERGQKMGRRGKREYRVGIKDWGLEEGRKVGEGERKGKGKVKGKVKGTGKGRAGEREGRGWEGS